jgi:hypothetical protein
MSMKYVSKLAAMTAGTLALAGCGGSSSSSSGAHFVTQANHICAGVNTKEAAMPAITNTAELLKESPEQLALVRDAITQLKALTPPAGKKAAAQQWIDGLQAETTTVTKTLSAIKTNNAAQGKVDAAELSKLNTAGNAEATSLGLTQCAKTVQGGSSSSG